MHSRVRIQQKGKMYSSSGGSRGGVWEAQSPLIFSPNGGPKGLKKILETSPPPPPFLRVWMTAPHPLSQGLNLALSRVHKNAKLGVFYTKSFEMTPVRLGRESL